MIKTLQLGLSLNVLCSVVVDVATSIYVYIVEEPVNSVKGHTFYEPLNCNLIYP